VSVFGVVAACVGGWFTLSVVGALGVGRAISIANARTNRLHPLEGGKVQHVPLQRVVTLNTAQIPKISVR
jgi:hypothetical protein